MRFGLQVRDVTLPTISCLLALVCSCKQSSAPETEPSAATRETNCFGSWRFELEPLNKEPGLVLPESWCTQLTGSFVAEARREENGSVTMTGTPFRPTDVLRAGGNCEFQFEGSTAGVPEHVSLIVEVPADATSVGSAKCTVWEPAADGRRTGDGVVYLVRGARQ